MSTAYASLTFGAEIHQGRVQGRKKNNIDNPGSFRYPES